MSYAPNVSSPQTQLEFAGFWRRTGAAVIDTLLLLIVEAPFMIWAYGVGYYTDLDKEFRWIEGRTDLIVGWVAPPIVTIFLWRKWQTTPGKFLFKAYVVDAETLGPATIIRYVLRYIGYFLAGLPFLLGVFWVAFDRRKQGWHDKLAGTVVIVRRTAKPSSETAV